jgi:putative iron-regulated protein
MILRQSLTVLAAAAALASTACDDGGAGSGLPSNASEAISTYAKIVHATYEDTLATATALKTSTDALIATPSEATLTAAKDAWRAAREPYLQTEVFRFYGGPIDDETDGPEGLINAWPMDEAYVDYVTGDPMSGHHQRRRMFPTIDAARALEIPQRAGRRGPTSPRAGTPSSSCSGGRTSPTGPGDRPFTDFATDGRHRPEPRAPRHLPPAWSPSSSSPTSPPCATRGRPGVATNYASALRAALQTPPRRSGACSRGMGS